MMTPHEERGKEVEFEEGKGIRQNDRGREAGGEGEGGYWEDSTVVTVANAA